VVGGLEQVYAINGNFRNEGIPARHNPEFTMLEFYPAYPDVDAAMAITEEIIAAAVTRVAGARPVVFKEREVSFKRPFARLTMKQAVAEAASAAGLGLEASILDDAAGLEAWTGGGALRGRRSAKGVALGPERYAGLGH